MKKIVLDENFFDELYNLELNENSYKRYDVINELLINKKEIKGDNLKLFTNGYVAKLISKRLRSIKSVDDVKFEINKLELFANNLPLDISKELFTNDEVIDSFLILKPKILNFILKDSDTRLLSIITNAYLKKYNEEKQKTEKLKEEYEELLEKSLMGEKLEQNALVSVKEKISKYSDKIKKQTLKEEKCLVFVMTLNTLLLDTLSNNNQNKTK